MKFTIAYITSRKEPRFEWFLQSLILQMPPRSEIPIIMVDFHADKVRRQTFKTLNGAVVRVRITPPKPTVWQGPYRKTKQNWWAASNSRNTAICLCETSWIVFLDDRSILLPGWLKALERAMRENYVVMGAYEKRVAVTVENGSIKNAGVVTGADCREQHLKDIKYADEVFPAPGEWLFGCCFALPLEWALVVNGFDERMDGLSAEDVLFGKMLENNKYPLRFDRTMKIVEDRSPGELGPVMKRESKERHPHDPQCKGHEAIRRFFGLKRSEHQWDLRNIRKALGEGQDFPIPTEPTKDWYDGQLLSEL